MLAGLRGTTQEQQRPGRKGRALLENLQLLCGACNSMKGAGTMEELLARLKSLQIPA